MIMHGLLSNGGLSVVLCLPMLYIIGLLLRTHMLDITIVVVGESMNLVGEGKDRQNLNMNERDVKLLQRSSCMHPDVRQLRY